MSKKSKDNRPSRSKQKNRSLSNKVNQLKNHLELYPKDSNAQNKLETIQKSGNPRKRSNVHPTEKILLRYADGKVKRDDKHNKSKRK